MLLKILKNSHLRLLFSGTLFAVAFIWMAISSYGVSKEEIKVFLIFSLLMVALLIGSGLFFSLFMSFFRSKRKGLLEKIEEAEKELQQNPASAENSPERVNSPGPDKRL